MGLLLPEKDPSIWVLVRPFFQLAFISSVGILALLLFLVGNLLWLAEKRRNQGQFPKAYIPGVTNGMWFALVTLTTVGYGDKAPVTKTGRLITSVWMLITMVTASSLTAGLASALTLAFSGQTQAQLENPRDLFEQKVAVVKNTSGAEWAEYYEAELIEVDDLPSAIESLVDGQAKAAIFDTPALKYYLRQNPELNVRLAPFSLATENYGFALPINSEIVHDLNRIIVKMDQEGEIEEITTNWLE